MTMSTGTLRVGILAIVAGLIGAYVIQQVMSNRPEVVEAAAPVATNIPMAAADLPEGRVVTMGDIVLVPMSKSELAKKNPNAEMVMVDPDQIIGRRLSESLSQGDLFVTSSMFLEYGKPDLSKRLKPGYRAYTLAMSSGASNFQSGQIVDVMFKSRPRPADDKKGILGIPEMTVTLLQSVEVLHVELPPPPKPGAGNERGPLDLTNLNRRRANAPPPTYVSLAVKPDQAKTLQTVMGHGEISLSPYAASDRIAAPETAKEGVTLESILGIKPPQPAVYIPPFVTETYRRGTAEIRGYRRDAIARFEAPKYQAPGTLPDPNALPAPKPQPMPPMNDAAPMPPAPMPEEAPAPPAPDQGK